MGCITSSQVKTEGRCEEEPALDQNQKEQNEDHENTLYEGQDGQKEEFSKAQNADRQKEQHIHVHGGSQKTPSRADDEEFLNKLFRFCYNGDLSSVQKLHKDSPDQMQCCINTPMDGRYAIHYASEYPKIVEYLVKECQADVNVADALGLTVLMTAVIAGDIALTFLRFLVEEANANIYQKRHGGIDAVDYACYYNCPQMLSYFISKGVELERCGCEMNGGSLLCTACSQGHFGIVQILLSAGISLESRDNGDFTSICVAANKGHEEIVLVLIEAGANVLAKGWNGNTLMHFAAHKGLMRVLEKLVLLEVPVDQPNLYGFQPLHMAVMREHHPSNEVMKFLLDKGANIDSQTKNGSSAMHLAISEGKVDVLEFLLENGANSSIRNSMGLTPQELAAHLSLPATILDKFGSTESMSKVLQGKTILSKAHKFVEFAAENMPSISLQNVLLISKDNLLTAGSIPHYDECEKNHWHVTAKDIEPLKEVLFVSHRWGSTDHPDPLNKQYEIIVKFLTEEPYINYIWMDYSCICQSTGSDLFRIHLQNIPTAVWRATHCLVIPRIQIITSSGDDKGSCTEISGMRDYVGRAWCVLEVMAAFLTESKVVGAYQFGLQIMFQAFGHPEVACSSLGFFAAQNKSWNSLKQIPPTVRANDILEHWEFKEPCTILCLIVKFITKAGGQLSKDETLQSMANDIFTQKLTKEDALADSEYLSKVWSLLGDCFKEDDKIIVFNLLLFIAFCAQQ